MSCKHDDLSGISRPAIIPLKNDSGVFYFKNVLTKNINSLYGVRVGVVIMADKGKLDGCNGRITIKSENNAESFSYPDDFVNCSIWLNKKLGEKHDAFTLYEKQAFRSNYHEEYSCHVDSIPVRIGDRGIFGMFMKKWDEKDERNFEKTRNAMMQIIRTTAVDKNWKDVWDKNSRIFDNQRTFDKQFKRGIFQQFWMRIPLRKVFDDVKLACEEAIPMTRDDGSWQKVENDAINAFEKSIHALHEDLQRGRKVYMSYRVEGGFGRVYSVDDLVSAFGIPEDRLFIVSGDDPASDIPEFNGRLYRSRDIFSETELPSDDDMVTMEATIEIEDFPEIENIILFDNRTMRGKWGLYRYWMPFVIVGNQ